MTLEKIVNELGVPEDSALYDLSKSIGKFIINNAELIDMEQYLNDYNYKSLVEAISKGSVPATLIMDGYKVYSFYASRNESNDPIEMLIGNGGLSDITSPNFTIKSEYED